MDFATHSNLPKIYKYSGTVSSSISINKFWKLAYFNVTYNL
jgi:hypothetical protein